MSPPTILTTTQQAFLRLVSRSSSVIRQFYLTGGTALTGYYIPYRYSEDLDFFSLTEVNTTAITVFLKSIQKALGYTTFDFNTSYNRNLFFLRVAGSVLKVEFTYFPFVPIHPPQIVGGVRVDSIEDIAVNKLFTIYQNPRSRDFLDLYMIHLTYHFSIDSLIKKAKIKFDWHVDPIKLGSQFLLAATLKDYPHLVKPLKPSLWQNFFLIEARRLGQNILT
jgi:predicted nucleotidyltransferase component of viral defense system